MEVIRAGGREFAPDIIERIRQAVSCKSELTRTELSRRVCEWLSWRQPNGRLREVSCRVALRKLEKRGVIELPPSQRKNWPDKVADSTVAESTDRVLQEPAVPMPSELRALGPIELLVVGSDASDEYRQWKEALAHFHPEGHVALPQAHVRYLIRCRYGVLGALCFSAAARQLAARDRHIGWSHAARTVNREWVVCNSRFLLLPWVKVKDLASHVLARAARQLPQDWQSACGLRPVLLETYVDASRYRASCYRAAGWQRVGSTSGRTRNDGARSRQSAVRDIYLLPLAGDYKQRLGSEPIGRKPSLPRAEASWARRELHGADLGDPRRSERLVRLLEAFYAKPNASIPQACHRSWGELKGAYRLLSNDDVSMRDILAPHYASTAERMNPEPVVLAVQDTTSLNYATHTATTGLGAIGNQADGALGLEVHDTLAFTPTGVPLGLLDVQVWARDRQQFGKKHTRRQRPIQDKESYKWLASFQAAAHAQRLCPHTRVVSIGDRESDVFELFELAVSRADHPSLLVRASVDRRVRSAGAVGLLWQQVESQPPQSEMREVQVPRTAERAARTAHLSIRFCPVELRPPRNGPGGRSSLRLWAVLAREEDAPSGVEPLEWLLLTTMEVGSFAQANEKVDWYVRRWGIEVYHHTLKSGCLVEEREITSAPGLTNCLAVDMIVAWRILYMTRLGREVPDLPCTAVFSQDEWQSVYTVTYPKKPLPGQPPSLSDFIRMLAKLGGHIGRKSDGPPGVESLWIALMRLSDISMCWRMFRPAARAP